MNFLKPNAGCFLNFSSLSTSCLDKANQRSWMKKNEKIEQYNRKAIAK